jgi:hydroxyethylthiazole kinase-like uncharacterized protein yjeF
VNATSPHALLTPAEMACADAVAPALGVLGAVLMANAGRAVARAIRRRVPPCRVLVLAGPGNNGGDGYVAARLLEQAGWPVRVATLAPPRPGSDAAGAAAGWHGPTMPVSAAAAARADLVVDAVFGAGLTRAVTGVAAAALAAARRVVAVDVPSGLDGETGTVRGFAAPALLTVTFFRRKPGHLLLPGRALCGETVLADIGMPPGVLARAAPTAFANHPALWVVPRPGIDAHKYTRGHVTVMGGREMTGAALLAAGAARHAGAGLVTIAAQGRADVYRAGAPGLLVSEAALEVLLADARRQVWVCGPGLGPDAAGQVLSVLLGARRTVVADADVFTAVAGAPERLRGVAVMTPHAGEFTRAFGESGSDRVTAVRAAARLTGGVVLLKGPDTIVAAPDGRVAINEGAPPWLATAGSGDVLAGIVAGLLAAGMPRWEAAAAAAWVHGRAATILGPGLLAEDLLGTLACALADATIAHMS